MTAPAARISMPGPMGALASDSATSLRLPAQHFAAALCYLALGALGLVWIAPELAAGLYLSPHVAGVTHFFTLGWLTMTIFGALYQLLPVALGVSVHSERLGHVSFWTFAPGVGVFASGVASSSVALRGIGAVLVTAGVTCLVINVALSLRQSTQRTVIRGAIIIALSFLVTTLALGLALVHNLHAGNLAEWRVRVLAVHLHVALIGWVLVMIVGISHRLLPMFLLAHDADTRWTKRALALLAGGVVVLAAGLVCGGLALGRAHAAIVQWIGLAAIEAGVACFFIQAIAFYRTRKRAQLDAGLRHAETALAFLATSCLLAPAVLWAGIAHPRLDTLYVVLGLLGGLTLYTVGQFYKIVPFLAWIARFRGDMGRKRVPTVAQMYSQRIARADLALFVAALVGIAGGIALGAVPLVRVAAVLFAGGVALFLSQIARVAFGTPRVGDPAPRRAPVSPVSIGAAS